MNARDKRGWGLPILALSSLLLFCQCGVVESLYPLYTDQDVFLDDSIVGGWQGYRGRDAPNNVITVTRSKEDPKGYAVEWPEKGLQKVELHLTRLGKYTFADIASPKSIFQNPNYPQPPIRMFRLHIFGPIKIEQKMLLLRLADIAEFRKVVTEQKDHYLQVTGPGLGDVITSPTSKLREFALENAENKKLYPLTTVLCRGDIDCAIETLKLRAQENPAGDYKVDLALEYMRRDRFQDASAAWRATAKPLSYRFDDPLVDAFITWGHTDEAVAVVKTVKYDTPEEADCWLAAVYAEANRPKDALAAMVHCDDNPIPHMSNSIVAYEQMGDFANARLEFQKPGVRSYVDRMVLVAADFAQADYQAALATLEKYPRAGKHWLYLALRHQGRNQQARQLLESEQFQVFTSRLALLRGQSQRLQAAEDYLRGKLDDGGLVAAIKTAKGQVVSREKCLAYFLIAEKHLLDGDRRKAREFFQKAVDTRAATTPEWIVANARVGQLR